jgi:hypothetical protein
MEVPSRDNIWPIHIMVNPSMPDLPPSTGASKLASGLDCLNNRDMLNTILPQTVDRCGCSFV